MFNALTESQLDASCGRKNAEPLPPGDRDAPCPVRPHLNSVFFESDGSKSRMVSPTATV
jgi:hypothetical protein